MCVSQIGTCLTHSSLHIVTTFTGMILRHSCFSITVQGIWQVMVRRQTTGRSTHTPGTSQTLSLDVQVEQPSSPPPIAILPLQGSHWHERWSNRLKRPRPPETTLPPPEPPLQSLQFPAGCEYRFGGKYSRTV